MDEFTRDLELMEALAASDAMNNAVVDLEDAHARGEIAPERWDEIRRWVFPLLEAEGERVGAEVDRLR